MDIIAPTTDSAAVASLRASASRRLKPLTCVPPSSKERGLPAASVLVSRIVLTTIATPLIDNSMDNTGQQWHTVR